MSPQPVLTSAIADHLRDFGVPSSRIVVKPNSLADPGPPPPLGNGFLYAARLVEEKGVKLLLDSWSPSLGRLRIAGDGPLRPLVAERPDVEYLGPLNRAGMRAAFDASSAVIVASLWADVLPTIAIEALAAGRPVLGTSMGGIPWVVGDAGWIVDPARFADGLAQAARELSDPATAAALSTRARARYESTFTPSAGAKALVDVYTDLVRSADPQAR